VKDSCVVDIKELLHTADVKWVDFSHVLIHIEDDGTSQSYRPETFPRSLYGEETLLYPLLTATEIRLTEHLKHSLSITGWF